ncbi:MAG: hypothetical protein V2A70_02480 [Candidatus Omnitrophota bacterium]
MFEEGIMIMRPFQENPVSVTGMAYVVNGRCGAVGQKMSWSCQSPKDASRMLQSQGFIQELPKNWGRFDALSLTTLAAALWGCVDAGLPMAQGKRRIGIVGSNLEGSLDSNRVFFADYMDAGRKSARSNLFVYTLPTTPLAEVALFCGFTGPVWHQQQTCSGVGGLVSAGALCASQDDIDAMLAVWAGSKEAVCFVLQKGKVKEIFSTLMIQERLEGMTAVGDILKALEVSFEHKGAV